MLIENIALLALGRMPQQIPTQRNTDWNTRLYHSLHVTNHDLSRVAFGVAMQVWSCEKVSDVADISV